MNRRTLIAAAGSAAMGLALLACSPLRLFDTLVPKDGGVRRVISGAAYGADPRQRLDVYRPSGASGPLPVIVFFYGGSWQNGMREGYSFVGRALAARGFVVVIPDYRLTPGTPYPGFLQDGSSATRWAIAHAAQIGADPGRIIVAGHSAGAYNAAMLAFDERWLGSDKSHVRGFIGLAGPYDFLPFDSPVTRAVFGGAGDLPSTQPVNFVDRGDPPAFIGSANDDRTVRERNSNSLAAKLQAAGVPVVRKRYPDIGHVGIVTAIARPLRGRASVLDDMAAFAHEVTR